MPHLVEMQKQYGKDGLVIITVDAEPPGDTDGARSALEFLQEKNIPLTNIAWDWSDVDAWQNKTELAAYPQYLLYNRQGKRVFTGHEEHDALERMIVEQLKK